MKLASALLLASLVGGCIMDEEADPTTSSTSQDVNETRPKHEHHVRGEANRHGGGGGGNGISYHGGPVMLGTVNIHYIWYGNWGSNSANSILTDLAQNLGGSPYENINSTYYNGSNQHVSGSISFAGSVNVSSITHGTALSDAQIEQIVADQSPTDANGIYMVLTSAEINATSGFCTQYCGWHTDATIGGRNIKYAFVGNPDRCPTSCEEQTASSPNGNPGADGMASIIAHESEEAISDPDLNAWYDRRGAENADKCAWTFGTEYNPGNGSLANVKLGSRDYLIQQNWLNANGGSCTMHYP